MVFVAIDEEDTPKIATEFITQVSFPAILPATFALSLQCTVYTGHSISAVY